MNMLGRYRLINDRLESEPYLERFYLFLKDRGNFPFNIFLHKFLKSDPDDCTIIHGILEALFYMVDIGSTQKKVSFGEDQ